MGKDKLFNLEEARSLIPSLREMLTECKQELQDKLESVRAANECSEAAEKAVDESGASADVSALRGARTRFQDAIQKLTAAQESYLNRLNFWIDRITDTGVILRDLNEGLLDFPCEEDGFSYLLCWRLDESDINFWHLDNDGFVGRKPLSALAEYR